MNKSEYKRIIKRFSPKEDKVRNALIAFVSGGLIGLISSIIYVIFLKYDFDTTSATSYTLIILILISSILTGFGIFDNFVEKFKCGLIIPITGFAHAISSEAIDNKKDGLIAGVGSGIFKLAGSVLLYGMVASFILTIIKVIFYG